MRKLPKALMYKHRGALGDQGFSVPVLRELRKYYGSIYLFCGKQGPMALGNTGLIDKFLVMPDEFKDKEIDEIGMDVYGYWLVWEMGKQGIRVSDDIQMDSVDMIGALANKYAFFLDDGIKASLPLEERIAYAKGESYFDAYTQLTADQLNMPEVYDAAKGKRPITRHTNTEKSWLKTFRHRHKIPKDAFILGWQLSGSAQHKLYPFLDDVLKPLMARHGEIYLVTTGPEWCEDLGGNTEGLRWINLSNKVTFRQAYILVSQYDCFVSPETGVMIFAQGYPDTPKILLATHSYGYHVTFGDDTRILHSGAECSPCYNIVVGLESEGCPQYEDDGDTFPVCIATITPESITAAIEEIYTRWNVGPPTPEERNRDGRQKHDGRYNSRSSRHYTGRSGRPVHRSANTG